MGVLSDKQIHHICEKLGAVTPFDPSLVNVASLDVRVGKSLLIESGGWWKDKLAGILNYFDTNESHDRSCWRKIDLSSTTAYNPFWLKRKDFCLVATLETFNMPTDVCAMFYLKSSRAREGYEHSHATFCDPGWTGSVLTMEISSLRKRRLPLYCGMPIGQIVFHLVDETPLGSYAKVGHYNNDERATASKFEG